jgi:hypothetical protein
LPSLKSRPRGGLKSQTKYKQVSPPSSPGSNDQDSDLESARSYMNAVLRNDFESIRRTHGFGLFDDSHESTHGSTTSKGPSIAYNTDGQNSVCSSTSPHSVHSNEMLGSVQGSGCGGGVQSSVKGKRPNSVHSVAYGEMPRGVQTTGRGSKRRYVPPLTRAEDATSYQEISVNEAFVPKRWSSASCGKKPARVGLPPQLPRFPTPSNQRTLRGILSCAASTRSFSSCASSVDDAGSLGFHSSTEQGRRSNDSASDSQSSFHIVDPQESLEWTHENHINKEV